MECLALFAGFLKTRAQISLHYHVSQLLWLVTSIADTHTGAGFVVTGKPCVLRAASVCVSVAALTPRITPCDTTVEITAILEKLPYDKVGFVVEDLLERACSDDTHDLNTHTLYPATDKLLMELLDRDK